MIGIQPDTLQIVAASRSYQQRSNMTRANNLMHHIGQQVTSMIFAISGRDAYENHKNVLINSICNAYF